MSGSASESKSSQESPHLPAAPAAKDLATNSESSSPPAPSSATASPPQPSNQSPPSTTPPPKDSSSNSSIQPDPGGDQIASPPPNNPSPPPFPPPSSPLPNYPPPSTLSPPETNPVFSPPSSFQPPPLSPPLLKPSPPPTPTQPPIQPPPNPPVPPPPNTFVIPPPSPLTPAPPPPGGKNHKLAPSITTGGDSRDRLPEGNFSSANTDSFAPITSSSHDISSGGVVITAIVVSSMIAVIAVVIVIFARRKRRMNGLEKQHMPHNPSATNPDGHHHRRVSSVGGNHFPFVFDASESLSSPSAGGTSCGLYGGYGYLSGLPEDVGSGPWFAYENLVTITNGFSLENKLGEGGFGSVYLGCFSDGRMVAVKQLKVGSGQGEREFRAEVEIISRIHHRHLVSLVGYCISEQHRLLVYEFVQNKTLEHHLHGKELYPLDWVKRVKIALGSARGLVYLHEYCHPRIIHRDIKSANILLDDSFEAKVADFGLAKLANDTSTHVSTRVVGTFGYMAPEYAASGKLTAKSDVFSFGVVLLELITGRKPVDTSRPLGEESLVEWARPHLVHAIETGDKEKLVDPKLEKNYPQDEMLRVIEVAAACVRRSALKRPRMVQVLRALENNEEIPDISNGVKVGESMVYNSDQYNADISRFQKLAFGNHEFSSGSSISSTDHEKSSSDFRKESIIDSSGPSQV